MTNESTYYQEYSLGLILFKFIEVIMSLTDDLLSSGTNFDKICVSNKNQKSKILKEMEDFIFLSQVKKKEKVCIEYTM